MNCDLWRSHGRNFCLWVVILCPELKPKKLFFKRKT